MLLLCTTTFMSPTQITIFMLCLFQVTVEMSTLRNKRIELLKGMQGKNIFKRMQIFNSKY